MKRAKILTSAQITKLVRRSDTAATKAAARVAASLLKSHALPWLNSFQARVNAPVEFCFCNGDFWLGNAHTNSSREFSKLNDALDSLAVDSRQKPCTTLRPHWNNYERRILRVFPELVWLWELAYGLDASLTRMMFDSFTPTVKPRGT